MKAFVISLVALLASWSPQAYGCKCIAMSLDQRLDQAQIAIVADVVSPHENPTVRGHALVRVVHSLKGDVAVESVVPIDPLSGTSCAGVVPRGSRLLIFGWRESPQDVKAAKCGMFLAQPLEIEGTVYKPSADVLEFIEAR